MTSKTKKPTRADLEDEIRNLKGQLRSAVRENQTVGQKLIEARFALERVMSCDQELINGVACEGLKRSR